MTQPLRILFACFFSVEMLFALLLFSGALKEVAGFRELNAIADLSVLIGAVLFPLVLIRRGLTGFLLLDRSKLEYLVSLFFFIFCCAASFFLGGISDDGMEKLAQLIVLGGGTTILAVLVFTTNESIDTFFAATIAIALFFAIYQLLSLFGLGLDSSMVATGYQWLSRICFIGFVVLVISLFRFSGWWYRSLAIFGSTVLFAGALVGGARQVSIAIFIVAVFLLFVNFRVSRPLHLFGLICLLFLLVLFATVLLEFFASQRGIRRIYEFLAIVSTLEFQTMLNVSGREFLFRDGFQLWLQYPWFGVGFGDFRLFASTYVYAHPHNVVIEILCELGLLGFCCFLFVICRPGYVLFAVHKQSVSYRLQAISALTLGYFLMMQTSGDLGTNRLLFPLMYLMLAANGAIKFTANQKSKSYPSVFHQPNPTSLGKRS